MIVVVGEALVDLVVEPSGTVTAALGGAPFNTARAAARLGAEVEFVGGLSDDRFGQQLRARLVADGVGVRHLASTDRPTTLAAAELDDHGAASYRFYLDGTSAPSLRPADVATVPTAPSVLFTGGLALALEPLASTVEGLIESVTAAAPASTIVFVDVNARPQVIGDRRAWSSRLERILPRAHVVKLSDEDLALVHPDVDAAAAIERVLELGPAAVVITAGAGGSTIHTRRAVEHVPVPPLTGEVVDTIGAGDTFDAAVAAWLDRHDARPGSLDLDTLREAVVAGQDAAAVVVMRRGADPPWRSELADSRSW